MRWRFALPIAVTTVLAGLVPAAPAGAEPSSAPSCSYSLSPPQVVSVSGTDMVTATVTSAGCAGRAAPVSAVVCVRAEGSGSADQCAEGKGLLPAQVYFTPYRPGTTYVSQGRGCATISTPPSWTCQSLEGRSATL